ncbi:hypothetical protein OSC27_10555 [Microbacterium sp. STN6]|uniref:hypothetical protein n=1 Tax=Microbacterium sp. STN6 TaxID=2995588 RepID=UPI0022609BD6|nr:hypothetical protein [Microbacterium sp. STN6]MCX7522717.1 hypothetical protein [Microbacterium sp. STN6]
MRRGINYDTGFNPSNEGLSRIAFDVGDVRRDMTTISEELHCDAVRVSGGDAERVAMAAGVAAEAGLEVWYSPFPCELEPEALLDHLADAARRAEQVRRHAPAVEVIFVAGCEISLFNRGYLAGDDLLSRLDALTSLAAGGDAASFADLFGRLSVALADIATAVRREFGGRISYASGPWEFIDWGPFDIVGVDAYRNAENAGVFRDELRAHHAHGKPVAVTEFGCCTYRGAGDAGGEGWLAVDESEGEKRMRPGTLRDEGEQSRYLTQLLPIFEEEGMDAAFWFTYAGWELPHRPDDPEHDLDLASYGVHAVLPDGSLRPKQVFETMAALHRG